MVYLQEMKKEEIANVLQWNIETEDFLMQWSNFTYPLTRKQYEERIDSNDFIVYSIYDGTTMIGTIQLFRMDYEKKLSMVGCFLINPELRNKGYGELALKEALHKLFENPPIGFGFEIAQLCVFDFNTGAKKCYEKCGFQTISEMVRPNGWLAYLMEKRKS